MLRHHSLEVCRAGGKCSSLAHFYSFSSKSRVWNNTDVRRESSEKTVIQKELHPLLLPQTHKANRKYKESQARRCISVFGRQRQEDCHGFGFDASLGYKVRLFQKKKKKKGNKGNKVQDSKPG